MKKSVKWLLIAVLLLAICLIPFKQDPYDDGGTVVYQAILYRYIRWNHIMSTDFYQGTELRWFPHNFGSLGEPNIN